MSCYEKKLKDKVGDEIKLAGLEALVPEELEKHLILNSIRLRTVEGCAAGNRDISGGEVWLRIRNSKPSDTGSRGHCDPIDVAVVNSLSLSLLAKEKGSLSPRDSRFKCREHIFIETAMHAKATASNHKAKANRASSGPRVRAKERLKIARGSSMEGPKEPKVPKVRTHW